ncbi:PIR protein [Plasmodium vivax]|uniref:VIR protein n=1 Tax=Plasmodium vivax TaxID=5855 RepID=A0A565A329_PLAVI|nr:PIR protein [Plasmodium vivax]
MFDDKEYILDKIKNEVYFYFLLNHSFIQKSDFYSIYKEFDKQCDSRNNGDVCYNGSIEELSEFTKVTELLKKLYGNLHKIFSSVAGRTNIYFGNANPNNEKLCCIYLKYWLYDKIITEELTENEINKLFEGWKNHVKDKINYYSLKHCIFHNLKKDEINKIKNIYAFNTLLYPNAEEFKTCTQNECKYMDYFGKGLNELNNSINNCYRNLPSENYCNELNEYLNICKADDKYAGTSIYQENNENIIKSGKKYALSVEEYENQPLLIYVEDQKLIYYGKTAHLINPKNKVITAVASATFSVVGISTIFLYLYKNTSFGSRFFNRKGKNKKILVDMDDKERNTLLYTSNNQQTPSKNREYTMTYQTFKNS